MTLKNLFSNKKKKERKPRNSFSNILREDRRRRIWPFVLFCLFCFLLTAAFELNLESYIGRELAFAKIQTNIERVTQTGMATSYLCFAGIGACLFGFQGFGWLMKREQVDFYHSQHMKREKRFQVIYLNGLIMCLVPMLLHVAVYAFLIGIRGYLSLITIQNILMNTLIFLISFLVMYHLVILSVMLCGNMIIAIMLAGTMFVYPTLIKNLVMGYFQTFFDTFTSSYADPIGWIGYLSPVEQVYRAGNYMIRGMFGQSCMAWGILAVMAAILAVLSRQLYKKRPSEVAGNALAFPYVGDIIRFLIVIPSGLFFGILFSAMSVMSSIFWLYFGTIVGAVLAHGFMEVVFHFDIKAAVGKKIQLLASMILLFCVVNIFCFDIFGYDSYVPEEKDLEEIAYFINIGEYENNYQLLDKDGVPVAVSGQDGDIYENGSISLASEHGSAFVVQEIVSSSVGPRPSNSSYYVYREEYQMNASKTKETGPILALIHGHMKETDSQMTGYSNGRDVQMIVSYGLKNGRTVYRTYLMDRAVVEKYYKPVYDTDYGKEVLFPYRNLSGEEVKLVKIQTPFMRETNLELTQEEIKELARCYREDILNLSFKELLNAQYIAEAEFVYDKPNGDNNNTELRLQLYMTENHKNMVQFFKERNLYLTLPNDNYEVTEVVVFNPYGGEDTLNHPFWKGRDEVLLEPDKFDDIVAIMEPDGYGYSGAKDYFLSGYMNVKNKKTGSQQQVYGNIPADLVPDYMNWDEESEMTE